MKKILTKIGSTLILLGSLTSLAYAQTNTVSNTQNAQPKTNTVDRSDSNWILLGKYGKDEYLLQKDSLKVFTYSTGPILRMTVNTNTANGILYSNLFFMVSSCKQKQGEIVYFTLDKSTHRTSMVVVGGKDILSQAATIMCDDYEYSMKHLSTLTEQEKKENSEWQDIAITENLITSYKRGTAHFIEVKNEPGIQFSGRVIDLKTQKVSLQNWSTSIEGCEKETGVLHIEDLSNKSFSISNYSFHSGSLSSLIAEDLCNKREDLEKARTSVKVKK